MKDLFSIVYSEIGIIEFDLLPAIQDNWEKCSCKRSKTHDAVTIEESCLVTSVVCPRQHDR